jgi:hypothetical protein
MGTRTVTLITALAATPALGAHASPAPSTAVPEANSYADLLQPIPNAVERLRAADAEEMARPPRLIQAQYHHHHHHHSHHHHHHHNSWGSYYSDPYYSNPYYSGSYYYGTPNYYGSPYYQYPNYNSQGYYYPQGRNYHHHHHHHHHHSSYPR